MAKPPSAVLTARQEMALRMISNFIVNRGFPPTVRELAGALGITSSTAFYLLGELEEKGYIRRDPQRARSSLPSVVRRSMTLPRYPAMRERPEDARGTESVPILGVAAAGQPILAVEDRRGDLWVDAIVTSRGKCFAIEIKGDSMIHAGINDGDIVVARRQSVAQSGEIVVALLGEEATVKELSIRGDRIELRPRNPKHRAIQIGPEDELRILGKVVAVAAASQPQHEGRT